MKTEDSPRPIDLAREPTLQLGRMEIRPATREVLLEGSPKVLEPRIMQVLVTLARRRAEVVPRDDLIAECWGGRAVSDDAINRCIQAIRKLADADGGFSVMTVARVGYRLEEAVLPTREPAAPTLAVLAFDNLSGDPSLGYFCDGVSEEIQQTVAQGAALKVFARSSSFQFRGAEKAVANVAAALGCTHLLDGSVRRGGSRVRISAELVDCASGGALWASQFDGNLTDVLALQESIAAAVARALNISLARPAQTTAIDPAVYELFLLARGLLAEGSPIAPADGLLRWPRREESPSPAASMLEQAVLAAPKFAPAWELLARARASAVLSDHVQGTHAEASAAVREAANAALRLDQKRGGAYVALSMLEPWGAYLARETLLLQALDISPRDPAILAEMSNFCWAVGRFREALPLAELACELNPLMPLAQLQVAEMRTYVGDYEMSIRMLQELHRRWPRHAGILLTLLNNAATLRYWEAFDGAVAAVDTFDGWQGADLRAARAYAEALRSQDPAIHARRLKRYTELLDRTGMLALNLVEAISQMGMVDEAFALAERASFAHIFDPEAARSTAFFPGAVLCRWSALNRSPRFIDLCDRLGLCAYWAQSGRWPDCVDWTHYDFKSEARRRADEARPPSSG